MFNFEEIIEIKHSSVPSRILQPVSGADQSNPLAEKSIESFSEQLISTNVLRPFSYTQNTTAEKKCGDFRTFAISGFCHLLLLLLLQKKL